MSAKQQSRTIVLQLKGSDEALVGTSDMVGSVIEALQNQYPKLTIVGTEHTGAVPLKPIITMPLIRKRMAAKQS